jgi:hypothetical protein
MRRVVLRQVKSSTRHVRKQHIVFSFFKLTIEGLATAGIFGDELGRTGILTFAVE